MQTMVIDFIKTNIKLTFSIFYKRSKFIEDINHDSEQELEKAVIYAIFINLVGLVGMIPFFVSAKMKFDSWPFILVDTAATVTFFLIYGLINHMISSKLLKSPNSLKSSMVTTIYMMIILMMSNFILVYLPHEVVRTILFYENYAELEQISSKYSFVFIFHVMIFIYWAIVQAKAFKISHNFSTAKTWVFGILSPIIIIAIMAITEPVTKNYLKPFVKENQTAQE